MRMNNDLAFNAVDLLNTYNKDQLINVFSKYGEIKNSIQLANSIIRIRRKTKQNNIRQKRTQNQMGIHGISATMR